MSRWLSLSVHVDHRWAVPGRGVQDSTIPRQGWCFLPGPAYVSHCASSQNLTLNYSVSQGMLHNLVDNTRTKKCAISRFVFTHLTKMLHILFLTVAICTLPVFRGASFCPGLTAEWPGLPSHAAALSEHGATAEPHVPHHQRLLSGELISESVSVITQKKIHQYDYVFTMTVYPCI